MMNQNRIGSSPQKDDPHPIRHGVCAWPPEVPVDDDDSDEDRDRVHDEGEKKVPEKEIHSNFFTYSNQNLSIINSTQNGYK